MLARQNTWGTASWVFDVPGVASSVMFCANQAWKDAICGWEKTEGVTGEGQGKERNLLVSWMAVLGV